MPAIVAMILRMLAGFGGEWAAKKGLGMLAGKAAEGAAKPMLAKALGHGATKFATGVGGFVVGDALAGGLVDGNHVPGTYQPTVDDMLMNGPHVRDFAGERAQVAGAVDHAELNQVLHDAFGITADDLMNATGGGRLI